MAGLFTVQQLAVGGFDHNFSYLVTTPARNSEDSDANATGIDPVEEGALIDPTGDWEILSAAWRGRTIRIRYILLTHLHNDHRENVQRAVATFHVPVYARFRHKLQEGEYHVADGEDIPLGDGALRVLYTPGHSRDSVCYCLSDGSGVFTGDTLFVDGCGYGEASALYETMKKLRGLPDSAQLWSGHDYGREKTSTIGVERWRNPCLKEQSFADFTEALQHI